MLSKLLLPIGLQILGVIIILAEFVLPSGGILTVAACAVCGYSLYLVFTISTGIGFVFVSADVIIFPILVLIGIKILANSPLTLKKTLSRQEGVTSQDSDLQSLIGKTGTIINDLRPAGRAIIENKRFDVISVGDYIEKNDTIIVTSVDGNRIVVKKLETDT
jgi:membrane-bound ClpP family serine protease